MSINGRRRFRSHQSTPPACTHCAPLSQTVRAAVSNGWSHCSQLGKSVIGNLKMKPVPVNR